MIQVVHLHYNLTPLDFSIQSIKSSPIMLCSLQNSQRIARTQLLLAIWYIPKHNY